MLSSRSRSNKITWVPLLTLLSQPPCLAFLWFSPTCSQQWLVHMWKCPLIVRLNHEKTLNIHLPSMPHLPQCINICRVYEYRHRVMLPCIHKPYTEWVWIKEWCYSGVGLTVDLATLVMNVQDTFLSLEFWHKSVLLYWPCQTLSLA